MTGYALAVGVCIVVVALLFQLLRKRRIREKYAGIWVLLTVAVIILGVFPGLAFWLSDLLGVEAPVNLVFACAFLVILAVVIHLSSEVSSLEEETRTLTEEIALLRLEVRTLQQVTGAPNPTVDDVPDVTPHRSTVSPPDDAGARNID